MDAKIGWLYEGKKPKLICLFKIDELIAKAYCQKVFISF
jgi:hypothetical protein